MARDDDQQRDGIVLDDGTWVDVGRDGRWHPSPGERARAGAILGVLIAVLLLAALILSVGDGGPERQTAGERAATTTTADVTTTTTTAPPDPSSIAGEPASEQCSADDRGAAPLRDRAEATVLVRNGSSRSGHAAATTAALEALGYTSITPGNADRLEVTSVAYTPGWCAEAERAVLDLQLLGATLGPVPDDLDVPVGQARLVVTLGADST